MKLKSFVLAKKSDSLETILALVLEFLFVGHGELHI